MWHVMGMIICWQMEQTFTPTISCQICFRTAYGRRLRGMCPAENSIQYHLACREIVICTLWYCITICLLKCWQKQCISLHWFHSFAGHLALNMFDMPGSYVHLRDKKKKKKRAENLAKGVCVMCCVFWLENVCIVQRVGVIFISGV